MDIKIRIKLIKFIIGMSIVLTMGSIITIEKGYGEIYPFFTWKLYTQPLGSTHNYTRYRFYTKENESDEYKRNNLIEHKQFSIETQEYLINYLAKEIKSENTENTKEKIKILCKTLYPNQKFGKLISENFLVDSIIIQPTAYDTIELAQF